MPVLQLLAWSCAAPGTGRGGGEETDGMLASRGSAPRDSPGLCAPVRGPLMRGLLKFQPGISWREPTTGLTGVIRPRERTPSAGAPYQLCTSWGSPVKRLGARSGGRRARGQVPPSRCLPRLPHWPHSRMNMLATPIHGEGVLNFRSKPHRFKFKRRPRAYAAAASAPSPSSASPSSSAVASWYCWYSATKSRGLDSGAHVSDASCAAAAMPVVAAALAGSETAAAARPPSLRARAAS